MAPWRFFYFYPYLTDPNSCSFFEADKTCAKGSAELRFYIHFLCLQWKKVAAFLLSEGGLESETLHFNIYYTWLHGCWFWLESREDLHSRHLKPKPQIRFAFLERIVLAGPILYFVSTWGTPQWNSWLSIYRWALCSGHNRKAGL